MILPENRRFPLLKFTLFVATAFVVAPAPVEAGSPRTNSCYPSVGQRGTEVDVVLSGSNLKDPRALLFDEPGLEASGITAAEGNKVKARIKIAASATLGEHKYRLITDSGIADLRLFYVTPFPIVEEQAEDKADPKKHQPVALGVTVYGRTQGEDQDCYEVEGKKGQRITAEVIGVRLQSQTLYDPAVSITKLDGTKLADVDDTAFNRQDPVASIVAPEDGKYLVTIRESTNQGSGECEYIMHIGSYAQPLGVYPNGGAIGEEMKVTLLGDAAGPLQQSVKLPGKEDPRFEVFANDGQPAPMPNLIRVVPFPNVLEAEPNDDVAHATAASETMPVAFNGIIEKQGDIDFFKFTAKKGQPYDLNVYARQLRSPLDSVLAIYSEKGDRIQLNDDDGQPDSHLRWSAPQDGPFYLSVTDQLKRGGPLFTYRVEVKPVQPRITAALPEIVQNSSQERRAISVPKGNRFASLVRIKRGDVGGDVKIEPVDLPAGVTAAPGDVDKSVDTVPIIFEAAADAAPSQKLFSLNLKLVDAPKDSAPVLTAVEHPIDIIENGNQKSFYSVMEDALPVAVTKEIPVKISLAQPKVPILQNGPMNLKIHADRQGDFKGPITLALLFSPTGIGSPGTGTIKEGESDATLIISANDKATVKSWKVCIVGSADFGSGTTWFSTGLIDLEVAPALLAGKIQRTFVDQGDSTTVTVTLEHKAEFEGKAKISLQGLPQGCTAEDQEITKDDKEVKFTVKADAKAMAGQHRQLFCNFSLLKNGEEMTSAFAQGGVLRVDKGAVAKNTETK